MPPVETNRALTEEEIAAQVEQFLAVLPDVVADVRAELGATGL
jgi:hypothetical protein